MTTAVGLKTGKGEQKSVILCTDRMGTSNNHILNKRVKRFNCKFYMDAGEQFVVFPTGPIGEEFQDLMDSFSSDTNSLKQKLNEGQCDDLLRLNLESWGYGYPDEDYVEFLMATRFSDEEPRLWTFEPLGKCYERNALSIGSGHKEAYYFLSNKFPASYKQLTRKKGFRLAIDVMEECQQDLNTSGVDYVLVTENRIHNLGKRYNEKIENYKSKYLEKEVRDIDKWE